ncbi:MAG: HAD-IA family hydrolase [Lachnospiraceae bacterium]|nr:HAD-IA family hydrolase [Lachnospiraceae bacterium]
MADLLDLSHTKAAPLFEGKTYFAEDIAADVGADLKELRTAWHATDPDRTTGKLTIEEAAEKTLRSLGIYEEEKVKTIARKRLEALGDSFSGMPDSSEELLEELHKRNIKIGLITNTYSDERDLIRGCRLFPYFDAVRISYEEGICKPDHSLYLSIMEELGAEPDECLFVGDGGSDELYAAREIGMKAVQAAWFHELAFEPHIPCPLLDEFPQAFDQKDILKWTED